MDKHSEYWRRRFEALESMSHERSLESLKEILRAYEQANESIKRSIAYWFLKFANNNAISLAEAKLLLEGKDLEEFHWSVNTYIERGETLDYSNEWRKKLINASSMVHISRFESLMLEVQQAVEVLYLTARKELPALLKEQVIDGYLGTAFETSKDLSEIKAESEVLGAVSRYLGTGFELSEDLSDVLEEVVQEESPKFLDKSIKEVLDEELRLDEATKKEKAAKKAKEEAQKALEEAKEAGKSKQAVKAAEQKAKEAEAKAKKLEAEAKEIKAAITASKQKALNKEALEPSKAPSKALPEMLEEETRPKEAPQGPKTKSEPLSQWKDKAVKQSTKKGPAKGKPIELKLDPEQITDKALEATINEAWTTDGQNFSKRLWKNQEALVTALREELTRSTILGEHPEEAAKRLAKRLNVDRSNASRLVVTEAAVMHAKGRKARFDETGVTHFEVDAILDKRTCSVCGPMDKRVFKIEDWKLGITVPPFHPRCRCTTFPYVDFAEFNTGPDGKPMTPMKRTARDPDTGETYLIDADTSYSEWAEGLKEEAGLRKKGKTKTIERAADGEEKQRDLYKVSEEPKEVERKRGKIDVREVEGTPHKMSASTKLKGGLEKRIEYHSQEITKAKDSYRKAGEKYGLDMDWLDETEFILVANEGDAQDKNAFASINQDSKQVFLRGDLASDKDILNFVKEHSLQENYLACGDQARSTLVHELGHGLHAEVAEKAYPDSFTSKEKRAKLAEDVVLALMEQDFDIGDVSGYAKDTINEEAEEAVIETLVHGLMNGKHSAQGREVLRIYGEAIQHGHGSSLS